MHVWNNDVNGYYTPFVMKIRELMGGDISRTWYVAGKVCRCMISFVSKINVLTCWFTCVATPRCEFPDITLGPYTSRPLTDIPASFDYVTPFFVSSPNICGWGVNNAGFWDTLRKWNNWAASLTTPLPVLVGLPAWYDPSWAQAAVGDYIDPGHIFNQSVVPKMKGYAMFAGVALQDTSFDYINRPCNETVSVRRRYSDIWWNQLQVSIADGGANTPTAQQCVVVNQRGTQTAGSGATTSTPSPRPTGITGSCVGQGTCQDYESAGSKRSGSHIMWGTALVTAVTALLGWMMM